MVFNGVSEAGGNCGTIAVGKVPVLCGTSIAVVDGISDVVVTVWVLWEKKHLHKSSHHH